VATPRDFIKPLPMLALVPVHLGAPTRDATVEHTLRPDVDSSERLRGRLRDIRNDLPRTHPLGLASTTADEALAHVTTRFCLAVEEALPSLGFSGVLSAVDRGAADVEDAQDSLVLETSTVNEVHDLDQDLTELGVVGGAKHLFSTVAAYTLLLGRARPPTTTRRPRAPSEVEDVAAELVQQAAFTSRPPACSQWGAAPLHAVVWAALVWSQSAHALVSTQPVRRASFWALAVQLISPLLNTTSVRRLT
jgi:hypothetical protein